MGEIVSSVGEALAVQLATSGAADNEPYVVNEDSVLVWGLVNRADVIGLPETFSLINGGWMQGTFSMLAVLKIGSKGEMDPDPFENFVPSNMSEVVLQLQ